MPRYIVNLPRCSVYLFVPRMWLGEHLSINAGSKSSLSLLPSEPKNGNLMRKNISPDNVALISP